MHIILDIDHTLIFSIPKDTPIDRKKLDGMTYYESDYFITVERPRLQKFLDKLFANFEVSVWTAGTEDYGEWILKNILKGRRITYYFHRDHCNTSYEIYGHIKDLRLLWDNFKLDFDPNSTMLVDDAMENYFHQKDKCVLIQKFFPFMRKDKELERVFKLILSIRNRIEPSN